MRNLWQEELHTSLGGQRSTFFGAALYLTLFLSALGADAPFGIDAGLGPPEVGQHELRILTPNLLELVLVNTKAPDPARVTLWDWADDNGNFIFPPGNSLVVKVDGQIRSFSAMGFKRRPVYAPLYPRDLRIGNYFYLRLSDSVLHGQSVQVLNDGSLWPTNVNFVTQMTSLRYSPAIHVNQEGYLPGFPKLAMIGYYLGSLGEMQVPTNRFYVVTPSGAVAWEGTLTPRPDEGFLFTPEPYQAVMEADFSAFNTPGEYRLMVPGLGTSMPFHIDAGVGMNFARTYALGLLHQRSGFDVALPFTRFTHAADHVAPVAVPTNAASPFEFTWETIADYASIVNSDNPPQTAPRLTEPGAQLYPYVNHGPVDVSGGHFEAGNYSKVAWNNAQIIHVLVYAADAFPGVVNLDNLGLPESGDGISDVLQEAKWEADCLAKMQDADGGFYYMIHPVDREYEGDVLPEDGDPQVAWPKNTASTAAAVAALMQCASSPAFRQAFPEAANGYRARALLGWQFLTNAIATHGFDGAYQRIMHFDDGFTHTDELAWAACEMFLATGNSAYRTLLETWMPAPASPDTARWGWWKMYACYGNAVRSYAAAVRSGRRTEADLNQAYLGECLRMITNCANDNLRWSRENAYGTSFPDHTKRTGWAGWYYSSEQAFDLAVAQTFAPSSAYVDAILKNLNFEAGCNPANVAYVTGLGWKRQTEVVDQYSDNDRRALPKIGVPISNISGGFVYTWSYGMELPALCSPSDGAEVAPYAFYDRWCDDWNVSTEASTPNTVRCFVAALWLAAQTAPAGQPWTWTPATVTVPATVLPGQPVTAVLEVPGQDLSAAKIIWEARDQKPVFGNLDYTFTPTAVEGSHWIEAEVHWPDGRRAFATNAVLVTTAINLPPQFTNPERLADGRFKFRLQGTPHRTCVIEAATIPWDWTPIATNELPDSGMLEFIDQQAAGLPRRYYRAVSLP